MRTEWWRRLVDDWLAYFRSQPLVIACVAMMLVVLAAAAVQAGGLVVAASPVYDPHTQIGMRDATIPFAPGWAVNNYGVAVGNGDKWVGGSVPHRGTRPVRWDASGSAGELDILGTDSSGIAYDRAFAINDAGTAVGYVEKHDSGGDKGQVAVRWDASGTTVTELGTLGTDSNGVTGAHAIAINAAGMVVGSAAKFENGASKGYRAVRWEAGGTVATELDALGTDSKGVTHAEAYAVNAAGTAVGYADKYDVNGVRQGSCAVRWGASGTVATELGFLAGDKYSDVSAINDAGTAVGCSIWSDSSGQYKSTRAVRWDPSGTAATELQNLGTDSNGRSNAEAYAINAAGAAVGFSVKFTDGAYKGWYAVRWDASGTAATELGNLGLNKSGVVYSKAYALNGAGTAVGSAEKYVNGHDEDHAVIWLPNGSVIDLNDLGVSPVSGGGTWTLTTATAISADGWVAGEGGFLPGGAEGYTRLWVAQVGLGGAWTNAAGGTWGRGPNWSTGTPAMQVGNATFDLPSAYTVALDRDEQTKTMAINAGKVAIDFHGHTLTTESGLSVVRDATLQGAGTIVSDIINAGTIAPGNSPGALSITGNLANTGTLEFDIVGLALYDHLDLTGAFTGGGTIAVNLLSGYVPAAGDHFSLMSFGSFLDGGYAFDFSQAEVSPGLRWDTSEFASTGGIAVMTTPEPSNLSLLGIGVAISLVCLWRRRRETA